mgnify:CR=1 FL=1
MVIASASSGRDAGHTGCFFNKKAPIFRAGIGDGADVALLYDGIGFRPDAAAQKNVEDVFETAGLFVQKVGTLTGSIQSPGQHDLRKVFELFRCGPVVVEQCQGDLGHV